MLAHFTTYEHALILSDQTYNIVTMGGNKIIFFP